MRWQIHTPDGVADLLPEECSAKRVLEERLRGIFSSRGYNEIETPGIEFYDVYATGISSVPQEELFKFFDERGRILCLRYDGTVPAARLAATLGRNMQPPIRLSYVGQMYRFRQAGGGRQREFSQAGIELLGVRTPEADAECIATAIAAARGCGITDLQVTIGQIAFFQALLRELQLTGDDADRLPILIDSKDRLGIEQMADRNDLSASARRLLLLLTGSGPAGDPIAQLDELAEGMQLTSALDALEDLRQVLSILQDYNLSRYISLDLGMLTNLHYYTGIIFKGFTYGIGFPLFSGGRYDRLIASFDRDLAATGFSLDLSLTMVALRRQGLLPTDTGHPLLLGYARGQRAAAFAAADSLREDGWQVTCDCENLSPEQLHERAGRQAAVFIDELGELTWLNPDKMGEIR